MRHYDAKHPKGIDRGPRSVSLYLERQTTATAAIKPGRMRPLLAKGYVTALGWRMGKPKGALP